MLSGRCVGLAAALAAGIVGTQLSADPAWARVISSSGTLGPTATVTVGSQVSGVVQEVLCDFNAAVKKGQVCARIDPRPFQRAVEQARANLANAKAQLDRNEAALTYSKASFERNSTLVQRGVVSKDVFENVQAGFGQAKAQVEIDKANIAQRQAELSLAELNLAYTSIASPIDGVVMNRRVEVGDTLNANFAAPTLFAIASELTRLQLVAQVSEGEIGGLKAGDAATFTVKAFGNRSFQGQVAQVRNLPESTRQDVSYAVVIDVDNKDQMLKPGMTAAVRITTADR